MQLGVRLVRKTVESLVKRGHLPELPSLLLGDLATSRSGIYIAVYENPGRKPRGRIGSYLPTKPSLSEEIISQSQRLVETFPLRKEDLPYLTYELLLIRPPTFLSTLSALRPPFGLLVRTSSGKQGVSLPGTRERMADERFREACDHGGIDPRTDDTRIYEFAVETVTESV